MLIEAWEGRRSSALGRAEAVTAKRRETDGRDGKQITAITMNVNVNVYVFEGKEGGRKKRGESRPKICSSNE